MRQAPQRRTTRTGALLTAGAVLLAKGWVYARETEDAAEIDREKRLRATRKSGVRGNVVPGQHCTFRTRNDAGPLGRAIAVEALEERVGAGISEGSPTDATARARGSPSTSPGNGHGCISPPPMAASAPARNLA